VLLKTDTSISFFVLVFNAAPYRDELDGKKSKIQRDTSCLGNVSERWSNKHEGGKKNNHIVTPKNGLGVYQVVP